MNIRAEVFAEAKNLALVLQWIKKIEAASSLEDLVNPKSITGKDFYDYEELDLMMAAELKWCYDRYSYFQKRIRVKEQRAQKDNRFLRGSQIAYLIYDITVCGAVTKGKGQKFLHRAEDWRMFFSGRLFDIVQEETLASFLHTHATGDRETTWEGNGRRKKISPRASILFSKGQSCD